MRLDAYKTSEMNIIDKCNRKKFLEISEDHSGVRLKIFR